MPSYTSTFQSTSYSSSTDSTGNTYTTSSVSDPSGTTIHETSQRAGETARTETTTFPTSGRVGDQGSNTRGRIEDVTETDADTTYEEKMEDEYAKREGGA